MLLEGGRELRGEGEGKGSEAEMAVEERGRSGCREMGRHWRAQELRNSRGEKCVAELQCERSALFAFFG